MIPVALVAVWFGHPWFTLLIAAAAGGMVWEWCRILGGTTAAQQAITGLLVGAMTVVVGAYESPAAGAVVALALATVLAVGCRRERSMFWMALGVLWILLPCIGFVWLRALPGVGFKVIVWLLVIVWTIDITAYACGRLIGGPKLAPRISPNKTWAGLIGGVIGAIVAGYSMTFVLGFDDRLGVALVSGLMAMVEQSGDMAESYAKRRFGVKDSGRLIPGHGGLLDRLDGMLAVSGAVVLMQLSGWNWK